MEQLFGDIEYGNGANQLYSIQDYNNKMNGEFYSCWRRLRASKIVII